MKADFIGNTEQIADLVGEDPVGTDAVAWGGQSGVREEFGRFHSVTRPPFPNLPRPFHLQPHLECVCAHRQFSP